MSVKALQEYTSYAKYARYLPEKKRRETWAEQVDRVFQMHERKFKKELENEEFRELFYSAKDAVVKRKVLGSQRTLQFGGEPIEKHNEKLYNCSTLYIDRPRAFQEVMFLLLCGCGVGFSVQNLHIDKLPEIRKITKEDKIFEIPDSIEGWSEALGILINSYFKNSLYPEYERCKIIFNYSLIRKEGAYISGGFKAPGPQGLERSLEKIRDIFEEVLLTEKKLRPIHAYDILMHSSDAVLSGGVRRSATICLFSPDDEEMATAKTGDWFVKNPQRGRSNNSALLVRSKIKKADFLKLIQSVKEFGEPGFIWVEDESVTFNPCCEIGLYPSLVEGDKETSGVSFCNLTEINGKKCKALEDFLDACTASAVIGTMQAAYTDFPYLGEVTEKIVKREALLGCSITGMMDNPDILFNPENQRAGAAIIKKINKKVSKLLNINVAARTTAIKPAGTTSCVLGTSSGIHPHHAKRYFRRVQANKLEFPAQYFASKNPDAVEDSVWSNNNTDVVLTFLCEVPVGSIVKNQLSAVELLEKVKLTQQNWVEFGTNKAECVKSYLRHNVSNTITVKNDEWDEVAQFIYENKKWFAGVSLLPASGDKDYPQAPFTTVNTPHEIVKDYGDGSVFASGLIVDGLKVFNNNLWEACDHVLGLRGLIEKLEKPEEPDEPKKNGYTQKQYIEKLKKYANDLTDFSIKEIKYNSAEEKIDWIRRVKQFSDRYFKKNLRQATYCLKDVSNWKTFCDLQRTYVDVDWSEVVEEDAFYEKVDTMGAVACSGGKCDLEF